MTLTERFPDVSMHIREKRKSDLRYKASQLFKDIHYDPIAFDQKFYDKEFRTWHYKLLISLGLLSTALIYLVLNGKTIFYWIVS